MKKITMLIMLILAGGLILLAGCSNDSTYFGGDSSSEKEGRVVFAVTDARADMSTVSEVQVKITGLEIYNSSDAWTSINTETNTYNLLELGAENREALLADANIEAGSYSKIRFDIEEVIIVKTDGTREEAKLPSNRFMMNAETRVSANSTTVVILDFLMGDALHITGNGKYIMAPVVNVQARSNARVDISNRNNVQISGGSISSSATAGMDLDGEVGVGVRVPANANISVDTFGSIEVANTEGLGLGIGAENEASTNSSPSASGETPGSSRVTTLIS